MQVQVICRTSIQHQLKALSHYCKVFPLYVSVAQLDRATAF